MLRNRFKAWTVALAALALVLLPGVAGAQKATGATSPEAAVQQLLDPAVNPSAGGDCNVITGNISGCFVSERFAQRVAGATENGNIVIRSQNPPQKINYTLVDNDGKTAHVDAQFVFGSMWYTITFVAINQSGAWVVDDSYCQDAPATSIYNAPAGPCNVIAAGGTAGGGTNPSTPGMPSTGGAAGASNDMALLIGGGVAVLVLLAGLAMVTASRRSRRA